jgi:hypothetical protein
MPSVDIVPASGEKARWPAVADGDYSKPVMLDLKQPLLAVEGRRNAF